ncbi:MAG: ABC transporter ATP-binding protein/permease [Clostridiales bacterium]|nr:ABC transporter ATP-binding protein/permease [Clostridiales bacterium]
MLQVKNISKSYTTGDFTQKALDGVSLNFRKNEFVAILGPSGSGKTTFLNVIGGLDKYDSGDLIINGKSTEHFSDSDWDSYRNNSIGFIFQSYNLITHLNIIDNVEMGMTLSGVSAEEKHKKALDALEKVGLKDHVHKKPNQLSGGQMQRVAIARALANDPDIILADEPTGALDKNTSRQIMDLIKEIADDKLVIMVTHNPALAEEYADRIVKFEDGKVIDDSNPYTESEEDKNYKLKKTSMSFGTALKLSFKNISTKKGRTFLTALASSIGIIGIALILSLSDGFQQQIEKYQSNALNEFPIMISQMSMDMDTSSMSDSSGDLQNLLSDEHETSDTNYVILDEADTQNVIHINNLSDEYIEYIESMDSEICNSIGYTRTVAMNVIKENDDGSVSVCSFPSGYAGTTSSSSDTLDLSSLMSTSYSLSGIGLSSYPVTLGDDSESYLEQYYDVLAGSLPEDEYGVVLVVDSDNTVTTTTMESLGFDVSGDTVSFDDIVGTEYEIVGNDVFYQKSEEYGIYMQSTDYDSMYGNENNIKVTITAVVRLKSTESIGLLGFGVCYSDDLVERVIEMNSASQMVQDILTSDVDITPSNPLTAVDESTRETLLLAYGGESVPSAIYIFPQNFDTKEEVLAYLDAYNEGKDEDDQVIYTDLSETITELTGSIMDAVTIVLIAFAGISLVVSMIMIAIIIWISVIERVKEIGILRALGARKKDITRVFNAETFIIGISSGVLGIGIAYLLTIPINMVIEHITGLPNVAVLSPLYALMLIAVSLILTLLGGFIPAKRAARKDPVTALRTE